uniref:Uncharacterized protein n=1 Tax=Ananas comosus var. bracteatus TaxID=296719 RepID=A0A6V7QJC7_ANACO|nr:unnamed protein product [Ananas comosus var. bracteatus]
MSGLRRRGCIAAIASSPRHRRTRKGKQPRAATTPDTTKERRETGRRQDPVAERPCSPRTTCFAMGRCSLAPSLVLVLVLVLLPCICAAAQAPATMLRRLALRSLSSLADAPPFRSRERKLLDPVFSGGRALHPHPHPHPHPHALALARSFLDLHKMGSREAIEKEKTRLYDLFPSIAVPSRAIRFKLAPPRLFALNTRSDELSRGYFADISEIRQNGGKIALANKTIIPAAAAVNFPNLEVSVPDGRKLKLPASSGEKQTDTSEMPIPLASLLCLSFRASSQRMAESWSLPFMDAFSASGKSKYMRKAVVFQVSFIDSWLLSLGPVKHLFLKIMKKSSNPQRQIVYAFGDNYDFRKKLQILNLLTG